MQIRDNDGQYWIKTEKALEIYKNLSVELFENTVRRVTERGTVDLQENPWIWQLEKLNDMYLLNEETVKIISERAGIAEDVFRDVIANEGYKIYKDSHEQLTTALQSSDPLDPQVQASLNALVDQTMGDINNIVNTRLPKSVAKTFNDIITDSVAGVVAGMKSQEKAISEAVQRAHKKGFYSFTDKAGRERSVEPHIRTIVKTTSFRTYREMREKTADDLGIDTFLYSSKSAARELCAPLQNQIVTKGETRVIKGEKVLSLDDYGYGKPQGCQGINCGHYMTPFVVGINEKPEISEGDNLGQEELVKNANEQARQRAFEREIRKSKELIEIAKIVNDKELEQKHKLRLKTLRSGLKQHIEKNPFLYRDTSRERRTGKNNFRYRSNIENDRLYRKSTPVRFTDEVSKFDKQIRNKDITVDGVKVANSKYGDMYVSKKALNKKQSVKFYDKQLQRVFDNLHVDVKGLPKPKVVIISPRESKKEVIASYDPRTNVLFVRSDLSTKEKITSLQSFNIGELAKANKVDSSMVHELGHWYQMQKTKSENPNKTYQELRLLNREGSHRLVEKLEKTGYNIRKELSAYADKNKARSPEEVYAEKFVVDYYKKR